MTQWLWNHPYITALLIAAALAVVGVAAYIVIVWVFGDSID
jgi:hypothetical protein